MTEKQARLLSYACDAFPRLIQGQDGVFQDLFETAWEKRSKATTGNDFDKSFEGGWQAMRDEAEELCRKIKSRFWWLPSNALNGINYDDTADILWSIHQVLRHQLWLDNPDREKLRYTVDAYPAMQYGSEPLITIKAKEE